MFGFFQAEEGVEIFFHLSCFDHGSWDTPPIVGEEVSAEYDLERKKAKKVRRTTPPKKLEGVVESFDQKNGWGFLRGDDRVSYYLHRSEVLGGTVPVRGDRAAFYAGHKKGRPRACYVSFTSL